MLAPVYVSYALPDNEEDRRRYLQGVIRGVFLPSPLIDRILSKINAPRGLDINFFRQGDSPDSLPFHVRSSLLRSAPAKVRPRASLEAGLHWTGEVTIANTRWTMIVVPVSGVSPLVNHRLSLLVLVVGLLLTVAFTINLKFSRRRTLRLRKTMAAIEYRSEILHAVSIAASNLLSASTLAEVLHNLLETVGKAVHVDRMLLLELKHPAGAKPVLSLRYSWHSADAPSVLDADSFVKTVQSEVEADPWFASLHELKVATGLTRTMNAGPAKALFESLGILSILVVPLVIDGKYWGRIGFDDCKTEREWTSLEIDTLQTLADMIGCSLIREHYIEEMKDAKRIIERSPTVLFRLGGDPSLPLIYVSHNVAMFGYDPAEMVASPQFYQTVMHPDDARKILELLTQIVKEGNEPATVEFRMRSSDGTYRWMECHYTPIRDAAGRLIEIEGVLTDISEKKETAEKIMVLARTDPLTGLANRATFIERLRQTFAVAKRGGSRFAILYIDLDHFKNANDTLGHAAGDLVLKSAAERLMRNCRECDLVARLGGDEFAILQTEKSDLSGAAALASKINGVLAIPYHLGDNQLHLNASIGISFYANETAGPDEMLAQADVALYRAKEEGRDQYRFHSKDLDQEMYERVTLTDDLRQALTKNELELYYQPQVELFTGRIAGMEALIRWNHPKHGLLKPADFLPIMEKTDVIVELGQWVLDHACEQMNSWCIAEIAPLTLAVNLSLDQLRSGEELIQSVTATLTKWGLSPADLVLDVTESMLAYATWAHNDVLEQLQQLGVKIAIDDFGTQYSSLDYVKRYRVSRLKIPQAMIANTDEAGHAFQ